MNTHDLRQRLIDQIRKDVHDNLHLLFCLPRMAVDIQGKQGYSERYQNLISNRKLTIGSGHYMLNIDCNTGDILASDHVTLIVYAIQPKDFNIQDTFTVYSALSKGELSPYINEMEYNLQRKRWLELFNE